MSWGKGNGNAKSRGKKTCCHTVYADMVTIEIQIMDKTFVGSSLVVYKCWGEVMLDVATLLA